MVTLLSIGFSRKSTKIMQTLRINTCFQYFNALSGAISIIIRLSGASRFAIANWFCICGAAVLETFY